MSDLSVEATIARDLQAEVKRLIAAREVLTERSRAQREAARNVDNYETRVKALLGAKRALNGAPITEDAIAYDLRHAEQRAKDDLR